MTENKAVRFLMLVLSVPDDLRHASVDFKLAPDRTLTLVNGRGMEVELSPAGRGEHAGHFGAMMMALLDDSERKAVQAAAKARGMKLADWATPLPEHVFDLGVYGTQYPAYPRAAIEETGMEMLHLMGLELAEAIGSVVTAVPLPGGKHIAYLRTWMPMGWADKAAFAHPDVQAALASMPQDVTAGTAREHVQRLLGAGRPKVEA